jgi:hypothetical protein
MKENDEAKVEPKIKVKGIEFKFSKVLDGYKK